MGPPTEAEHIAKTIFYHLQMFQYLEDVRKHDKKAWSTFMSHSVNFNDNINIDFLKKWDEDQNSCEGNAKHWDVKDEAISEKQFVELFVKDAAEEDNVFGGRGLIESLLSSMGVILLSNKNGIYLHL